MNTIVIMPGGFHPFHAGHAALYNSARQAFPDADVYVAATNSQEERPFPFSVKEKLAKVAGVEPGHFVQVKSPFSSEEITSKYDPNDTVLIFVKSQKNAKNGSDPEGPFPAEVDPSTGKLPLVTRGPRKGQPVSDRLQYYKGNEKNLQPMSRHSYLAYLPTVKFGPGITSATEIRKAWPTLDDRRKTAMVMSLYPASQKNPKLAANIVGMLDQVMGGGGELAEGFGLPMPTTYEQERGIRTPSRAQHITAMTNEEHDLDPELRDVYQYALQRYPNARSKQEAFVKYAQRALMHSEKDDIEQTQRINVLDKEVDQLQKQMKQVKVSESADYLDEK